MLNDMPSPWSPEVLQGRHVMVVDDCAPERLLLAGYLQRDGCHVYTAQDGLEGFKKAVLLKLDLILMDIGMPICNGLDACHLLKMDPRTRSVPVIFLTGAGNPQDRVRGLMAGAVDYVTKPFLLDEVRLRLIVHLLARHAPVPVPLHKADQSVDKTGRPFSSMDSILFQSVRLQLIENLHQTPDLAELARVSGVGKKRLNEAFRQCVGVTVLEYLREERMRQACVRLTETTLNMQEIALALGFSSGANFATAFKERFGLCPSDFRAVRSGTGPVISRLATDAA